MFIPSERAVFTNFFLLSILLTHHNIQGQVNKVSSKLDFDDDNNNNNAAGRTLNNQTGVPVIIGQGQGGGQQGVNSYNPNSQSGGGSGSGSGGGGGGSGSGNRPKIHGVRVTVDTGDGQQQTKESKESVEITDLGKHKKRVGIHTDITFEITSDGDGNETNSAQQVDKEDASVPIYKGRSSSGSESRHKTRKPYDPKSQWNPNRSDERHAYDGGRSRSASGSRSGSDNSGYYPQYYPQHVYNSGGGASDTGSIYRDGETWTHYVPVWTTERPPMEQSQVYRQPSWKPCYCMSSYGVDYRRRRESKNTGKASSGVIQVVDAKLEQPFS